MASEIYVQHTTGSPSCRDDFTLSKPMKLLCDTIMAGQALKVNIASVPLGHTLPEARHSLPSLCGLPSYTLAAAGELCAWIFKRLPPKMSCYVHLPKTDDRDGHFFLLSSRFWAHLTLAVVLILVWFQVEWLYGLSFRLILNLTIADYLSHVFIHSPKSPHLLWLRVIIVWCFPKFYHLPFPLIPDWMLFKFLFLQDLHLWKLFFEKYIFCFFLFPVG